MVHRLESIVHISGYQSQLVRGTNCDNAIYTNGSCVLDREWRYLHLYNLFVVSKLTLGNCIHYAKVSLYVSLGIEGLICDTMQLWGALCNVQNPSQTQSFSCMACSSPLRISEREGEMRSEGWGFDLPIPPLEREFGGVLEHPPSFLAPISYTIIFIVDYLVVAACGFPRKEFTRKLLCLFVVRYSSYHMNWLVVVLLAIGVICWSYLS